MIVLSQKLEILQRLLGTPDIDRRSINAQYWCPICKDSDHKKKKLAVRLEDGIAHCWVCGWSARNIAIIAPLIGRKDLLTELVTVFGETKQQLVESSDKLEKIVKLPTDFSLIGNLLNKQIRDPDQIACIKYLSSRNITESMVWSYRLGVSNQGMYRRRVIFPSFDKEGNLNYVTSRIASEDIKPKYFNIDVDRRSVVFNELDINWKKELIVVEGPFDLLSCHNMNATTSLGSWLDEKYKLFENIVINQTPVVLAFDPDAKEKQDKVAEKLFKYGISVRALNWQITSKDIDPGSIGAAQFRKLVELAPYITSQETFSSRLNRVLDSVRLM